MALGIIYIIPLLNESYSLVNPYQNKEISQNKIISGLIDLLLNEELSDQIILIEFKSTEIQIIYELENEMQANQLRKCDFYGLSIRFKVDEQNKLKYVYRIPWKGKSDSANQEFSNIKNIIGKKFILSNYYDYNSDTYSLIVNETKNIVAIFLRLHEANSIQNFNIKMEPGPNKFTTISLKPF